MPIRARISHSKKLLLYALAASAFVSCSLSAVLIYWTNAGNTERIVLRRATQSMAIVQILEKKLSLTGKRIEEISQDEFRLLHEEMRFAAAAAVDLIQVFIYATNGAEAYRLEQAGELPSPTHRDDPRIDLALRGESVNDVEVINNRSILRSVLPLHDQSQSVIGVVEIWADISPAQDLFESANRKNLLAIIALILASTVPLYLIGHEFIRRMGAALISQAHAEQALERSESLARVGLMVAGLSHQLRNPLSILNGIVSALNRRPALDEQKPFLKALNEETARIIHLCEVFLDFARPLHVELESCNVRDLIRKLEVFMASKAPHAKLTVLGNPSLKWQIDSELIFQLLVNITQNSIEAVSKEKIPEIVLSYGQANSSLSIQLSDNGTGFDEEQLQQVPQPFYSTKAKGSGLGLAVADKIAVAHKGKIEFGNLPSGGAQVTLTIPNPQGV